MSLTHQLSAGPLPAAGHTAAGRLRAAPIAASALAGLAAVAFAVLYVGHEQPAYYWDWTAYFDRYRDYGAMFTAGGADWLRTLAASVRYADYNVAVLTPMLPAYAVLGDGRPVYIATIVALFLLPAAALAATLAGRAVSERAVSERTRAQAAWLFTTALCFWPLWIAALRGMPDVAGLVPLGGATLLVIRTRYLTQASVCHGIWLGVLVWLSFLLRRWYAYADVALEASSLVFAVWAAIRLPGARTAALRSAASAFAANVAAALALLLLFQAPLAWRILDTSYADIYAAYRFPLSQTAELFAAQMGVGLLAVTGVGVLRALRTGNTAVLFMAGLAALTALLFLRTQAPGAQHILPVCFWMFPVAVFGALWPITGRPSSHLRRAAVSLLMLSGFAAAFVPAAAGLSGAVRPLLPWQPYHPLRLENAAAYGRLIGDLEARLKAPGAAFAVFASSPHLSGSLLKSLAPDLARSLIEVADVDRRDGLRLAPFEARFAVATTTPALHLQAAAQQVVAIPDAMIAGGSSSGLGRGYARIAGPYALDGGIEAFIYERVRPFSAQDADEVTRALQAVYPGWTRRADGLVR